MKKVKVSEKSLIDKFISRDECHYPLLKAMLLGHLKSEIYVDCISDPSAMFVLGDNNWSYSLGAFDSSDLGHKVVQMVENRVIEIDQPVLWFGISEKTHKLLSESGTLTLNRFPRFRFHYAGCDMEANRIDSSISIEPITSDNIKSFIHYNIDFNQFWDSQDQFLKNGIGFLAKDNEKIIGHAYSASVCENEVEIDLMTLESHRGQGISTRLTTSLVEACKEHNLLPKWDCSINNSASIKLAIKHGFVVQDQYPFAYIDKMKEISE